MPAATRSFCTAKFLQTHKDKFEEKKRECPWRIHIAPDVGYLSDAWEIKSEQEHKRMTLR